MRQRIRTVWQQFSSQWTPQRIAIFLVVIGVLGKIDGPMPYVQGIQEFYRDISSEFIGMGLTVLIIDAVVERRDQRRWQGAKGYLLAKLFTATEDFLDGYGIHVDNVNLEYWYFGVAEVMSSAGSYKEASIVTVKTRIENSADVLKYLNQKFDVAPLNRFQSDLDQILGSLAFLMDPEIIILISELDMRLRNAHLRKNGEADSFSKALIPSLTAAVELRKYIETKATERITFEEHNQRWQRSIADFREEVK